MRSGITFQSVRTLAVLALAAVAASCDKAPLLAPTSSTITITAPTRVLPLGGTTEISAFVIEQAGTPVQNGTTVHFVTSLGTLSPVDAQTHNGMATTTFQAGDVSGVAEIRAISGNAGAGSTGNTGTGGTGGTGSTTTAGNVVQITVGAAAVDNVSIRTNPATVSQNGGTVDVIATVLAAGGRALPNVAVTFSADHGTLSASSGLTDSNGEARVQLTTNVDTSITASAGGKTAATAAKVTAQPGPSITLTCASSTSSNCSTVNVGDVAAFTLARGQTTSNIRTAVLDFGDGTNIELGNLSSQATVSHQYTQTGTYIVRLTATDVNGEVATSTLVIVVQEVVSISLALTQTGVHAITAQATVLGCVAQRYDWNFGNGATPASFSTAGNTASSTYVAGGTKTVIVSARCTDGRTAQTSSQLDLPLP